MSRITVDQQDELAEVIDIITTAAVPAILEVIGACSVRDYRKEVWLAGFSNPQKWADSFTFADIVLAEFDKRFPK